MKLLQKTNRIHLLFTSILIILTGCVLYFLIVAIVEEEVTEKLYVNKQRIVENLKSELPVSQLPPVIEIKEISSADIIPLTVNEVLLYDPIEQDEELFKELSKSENINGINYLITVRQVILEPHDYWNTIGLALGMMLLVLLIGLLIINKLVAKKIWKPFYQNLEILKSYSLENDKSLCLKSSQIEEFEQLNEVITKLTNRIKDDFVSLKEFTENAAHEMQTPLAIIQSKLEEGLQLTNLKEEQALLIQSSLTATKRLSKLNQSLLLLAKLENHQFNETEKIELSLAIENCLNEFNDLIVSKQIKLTTSIEKRIIRVHPQLLNMLLTNLIGNAIKHNLNKGTIHIDLNQNGLIIKNTGEQTEKTPEDFFKRFVKSNQSSSSLGLGLSIVQRICKTYDWKVNYEIRENIHLIKVEL